MLFNKYFIIVMQYRLTPDFLAGAFLAVIVDFLGSADCEKSTFGPSPGFDEVTVF